MPMPFNDAVMTNGGAALLTKAQAGECMMEFTRMVIGDGTYTAEEETVAALQARTSLKDPKNSYTLSDYTVYNEYSVKVTALLTNQDPVTLETLVTEGYYINEIALYAKEQGGDDSTEVMYSMATTSGEQGDFMPPFNGINPTEITQDYFATVNNALEVTINSSGAALLVEDANTIRDDTTKLKYRIGIDNGYMYIEEVDD